MENTAKIYIIGAAAILVSGIKLDVWKLVEKYAPEALEIVDENGDPVFKVMTGEGGGSVNQYGIVWGSYLGEDGQATVTVLLDEDIEKKREAVSDIMGSALLDLMDIEKEVPGILEEIREKEKKIGERIIII